MGKRIESLDMAKGVGIVAVLVMHICVMGTAGSLVFMALFSYMMPFYFFVSGYTYKPGRGIGANIARRARQILIPMFKYVLVVSVICIIWDALRGQAAIGQSLNDALRGLIGEQFLGFRLENYFTTTGIALRAYWFMRQMFFSSVIFFCTADWALKDSRRTWAVSLGLLVISCLLMELPYKLPVNLDCAPALAGWMLLGTEAARRRIFAPEKSSDKGHLPKVLGTAAVAIVFSVVFPGLHLLARGSFGTHGGWSVFTATVQGLCGSYALIHICGYLEKYKPVRQALLYLGRNTIPILLLHMMFAAFFSQVTGLRASYSVTNIQIEASAGASAESVLVMVVTLALCLGTIEVQRRLQQKRSPL